MIKGSVNAPQAIEFLKLLQNLKVRPNAVEELYSTRS